MFEQYGAVAVLVANNKDSTHVYALSGDYSLITSIPTRMISEYAGHTITHSIGLYNDVIYADFGCFEHTEFPNLVCLTDYSNIGEYVYLDGEYQRQLLPINDHPYYLKTGHYGLFEHLFMWLDIDRTVSGEDSWRWVIGTNWNDVNSIVAECKDNGEHYDHPGLCGNNWYINDTLRATITVSNDSCVLSDNYVCLDSAANTWFSFWFDGMYRQIHDGVSLWLYTHDTFDSYITVGQVYFPPYLTEPSWAFSVVLNQTDIWAFCVIGDGKTQPTAEQMMKPYECTDDWHVLGLDANSQYTWYIDLAFDIDQCVHPNISTTANVIDYPQALCLADPTNTYSHYQTQYGVWVLDTNKTFDGKYVYYNQRLKDNHDEWYMMWYEEKDAWVINQMIPEITVVHDHDGICRSDVDTPDECTACWEFYQGFKYEKNCNIAIRTTTSLEESDCMTLPQAPAVMNYTDRTAVCFDDGYSSEWANAYTANWYRETVYQYAGREYWYTLADDGVTQQYYMFYDPTWRFWVIDSILGNIEDSYWHWYCLRWDEFEPFNCDTWYSRNYNWTMTMNTTCYSDSPTKAPSASPTTAMPTSHPTVDCNARNAFVYADWTMPEILGRTITSTYVNFAPYSYDTIHNVQLVVFENGRNMSIDSSNPCIMSTWQEQFMYYYGKIVMLELNDLCHMERQVLNLEFMGVKAVLIQNNADWTHVYALAGDDTLSAFPTIPTRMISQLDGIYPLNYVIDAGHEVYISIDCYDDTIDYPSIICLVDTSSNGMRVYLDGEYQRQSSWWTINDHPIWYKQGHDGLWKDIYMWLAIETENGNDAWKWVIGTRYWDDSSIIAICDVNGTHIEHPALCGRNWYVNDTLEATIVTNDTECHLGDSYFCVDANPGGIFDIYFTGQYRQIHDGVHVWIHEDPTTDMYIAATTMTFPAIGLNTEAWVFAFIINQTDTWAFCIIGDGSYPTDMERLSPHECGQLNDWYVMEFDYTSMQYYWVIDYAFDVDECTHPDISTTKAPAINYPTSLCLNDPTGALSHYQGHYGIYNLVDPNTTTSHFDGRRIYENQRLKDVVENYYEDEWYILWYEEKDSWVINQMVPNQWATTVVRDHEGICRDDVLTPDLCTACWQFYYLRGMLAETNCNVQLNIIDSTNEADCITLPTATPRDELWEEQSVGFWDGYVDMKHNVYSGEYKMGENYYGNRPYYHKIAATETHASLNRTYYIWYDETWRYWVLNDRLGTSDYADWELFCLDWMSWEPWNCQYWHSPGSFDVTRMTTTYEYPEIICLVDMSSNGKRVYLDGEYERQSGWISINDYPIYHKDGKPGLWQDIYMWLSVQTGNRWVIGTNYSDETSIIALCGKVDIQNPSLCSENWWVNNTLETSIVTNDTQCHLGDSYFCVDANPGGIFDIYFTGQYRQVHDGVHVWIHEDETTDMYIAATTMTFPYIGMNTESWVFAFIINQTDTWAFCIIGDGSYPDDMERLSPHECGQLNDWYVMEFDYTSMQYYWVIDYAFDVDECTHPDISTTKEPAIDYPKRLCLSDPTGALSHYQGHYGIYNLVNYNETTGHFDGRRIYENSRLKDVVENYYEDEWYLLWYEEKDSWVINQMVPNQWATTVVRDHEGICRDDVLTPDLCTACWQFYYLRGMLAETNCNVQLNIIDSTNEADCVFLPTPTPREDLFEVQSVGFWDGYVDMKDNVYSGEYKMGENYYGNRPYYHKITATETHASLNRTYYIWYDETWRYWVLNDRLGTSDYADWELFCLDWMSWEPWNCEYWHSPGSFDITTMTTTHEYPEIICLVDMSSNGKRVYLDGEYERNSAWLSINDYPIYHKDGKDGLWKDMFMWLSVVFGNRWVIGTKYWDENTVIAICGDVGTDNPSLCTENWYINNTLEASIVTNGTECHLGDSYFCVDSNPGSLFDSWFAGQYRQVHNGVAVWIHEDEHTDMYIGATTMTFPAIGLYNEAWVFAFIINQTQTWAFCIIGDGSYPSDIDMLSPHDCGQHNDWLVMEFDYNYQQYFWQIDYAFDVDECTHPDISTTKAPAIDYPKSLCLRDPTGTQSHYQGHYGIYRLVNYNETNHGYFDGRRIYENQRLKDVSDNNYEDEWYILWYEEKDSWVINQLIPDQWTTTVVRDHEAICREDVLTPDLCNECWEFYYLQGLLTEKNCNVELTIIDSTDEADCMTLPTEVSRNNLWAEVTAGFSSIYVNATSNPYSGTYKMGEDYYGDRPYYYKHIVEGTKDRRSLMSGLSGFNTTYYIWFDETWRYWVFHDELGTRDYSEWFMFCFDWMSYEPWNCEEWHRSDSLTTMQMTIEGTVAQTTAAPANTEEDRPSLWYLWLIGGGVAFICCLMGMRLMKRRKNKNAEYDFDHRGSHSAVHLGTPPEDKVDISMVQMYGDSGTPGRTPGSGTRSGVGESATPHHASQESGSSGNNNNGIDGLDGDETGRLARNSKSRSGSGSGSGTGGSSNNPEKPLTEVAHNPQFVARRSTTGTVTGHIDVMDLRESEDEDNDNDEAMYDENGRRPTVKGNNANPFDEDAQQVEDMLHVGSMEAKSKWVKFEE